MSTMTASVRKTQVREVIKPKYGEVWSVRNNFGVVRDYLVISNDIGNAASRIFMGAAIIVGEKRKPTQMQWENKVVMFENIKTLSIERLVKKKGSIEGDFSWYIQAVSKECTPEKSKIANLYPAGIRQWGAYFIDLGEGVGSEQAGERLVVVCSNDILNKTGKITVIPATTRLKRPLATHVDIPSEIGIPNDSTLMLEQITSVDTTKFAKANIVAMVPQSIVEDILIAKDIATSGKIKTFADIRNVQLKSINKWKKKNA